MVETFDVETGFQHTHANTHMLKRLNQSLFINKSIINQNNNPKKHLCNEIFIAHRQTQDTLIQTYDCKQHLYHTYDDGISIVMKFQLTKIKS